MKVLERVTAQRCATSALLEGRTALSVCLESGLLAIKCFDTPVYYAYGACVLC